MDEGKEEEEEEEIEVEGTEGEIEGGIQISLVDGGFEVDDFTSTGICDVDAMAFSVGIAAVDDVVVDVCRFRLIRYFASTSRRFTSSSRP